MKFNKHVGYHCDYKSSNCLVGKNEAKSIKFISLVDRSEMIICVGCYKEFIFELLEQFKLLDYEDIS